MISRFILTLMLTSLVAVACESRANRTEFQNRDVTYVLRPIESSLTESAKRVGDASENRIAKRLEEAGSFSKAQFVNRQIGWASTGQILFTTSDEGKTWDRLPFKAPDQGYISSFFFVDEFRGWLAVTKRVYNERHPLGNSSIIYKTKDGGRIWSEQSHFPDEVRISQVSFLDANRGVAIGARIIDRPAEQGAPYARILVLSTQNGGEVWTDLSGAVKTAIGRDPGETATSIQWLSPVELFLLTGNGRLLQTSDSGATWKEVVKFQDERPNGWVSSIGYYKVIFDPDQKIRVIAGAMWDEGFWGDLIVNAKDTWTSYELTRVPIHDAIFLSANEVLAAGVSLPRADEEPASKAAGVILKSLDCGKSWTPIYRSNTAEMFISLTKISEKEFYAVSDAGTFLKFTLND